MKTLLPFLFSMLFLAFLSDNHEMHQPFSHRRKKRKNFWFIALALSMTIFVGLRVDGNDTVAYVYHYETIPLWDEFIENFEYTFAGVAGFNALSSLIKTLGCTTQDFLMIFAFLTVMPYMIFIHRHSRSMLASVFMMFVTGMYIFSMAAMKQCSAMALCLLATNALIDRKYFRYLLLVATATLFHPYSIIYLLLPMLTFKPWTPKTFVFMTIFMIVGIFLEPLLGAVLGITDMMGANYDEESFTGAGINIFRVMVSFVPVFIAFFCRDGLFRDSTRAQDLLFNMTMMNALIMFVGIFGTANYFARLANYFLPAQVISVPWVLSKTRRSDRRLYTIACVAGYSAYFYYEFGILRPYDSGFISITLWEYLSSLLSR